MTDFAQLASAAHWKKIGVRPRHGIAIPLASLFTHKSGGIGEFYDLIPLIDWCCEVGFDLIQLLPLNDTGNDISPYNILSSCALHPIYLSLKHFSASAPRISYSEVLASKLSFLHHYFKTEGQALLHQEAFETFISSHPWLAPYALFKVLKEKLQHLSWFDWPEELKSLHFKKLAAEYEHEMLFHFLLQYLCHLQLSEVKEYADSKGILIKGDIPLLVSADSADVWFKPHLFNFDYSAGAPPDHYNTAGQSWGFPLFHWDNLKAADFAWWKERLSAASNYYDLYRIDHVVGLFRIWAIPFQKTSAEGLFLPENPALWVPQGEEILQMMLKTSSMLPIAEDLGTVPPSVRATLADLGICSTKVIRWERRYDQKKEFIPFRAYPILSMTTVSTHDSETLQLWWQDSSEEAKAFCKFQGWTYSPDLSYDQRLAILRQSHHTPSLFHINLLPEYLALFPELVASDPRSERINIPGKILPTNWTFRLHRPLEEISSHLPLKKAIASLLK